MSYQPISNQNNKLNFKSYYSEKPKIVFLKKNLLDSVLTFRKVRDGNKFLNLSKKLPKNGDYYKIDNYSQIVSMKEVNSDSHFVKKFIEEYYILAEIKGALKNLTIEYLRVINVSMDNHVYIYSLKDDNNKTINNLKLLIDVKNINEPHKNNDINSMRYNTMFYFFISNTPNRNNNNRY